MIIYLGTNSEIKVKAVREAIPEIDFFRNNIYTKIIIKTFETSSLVPETPLDAEAYVGAKNRALELFKEHKSDGKVFVGLESALTIRYGRYFEECWCCILDKYCKEYLGYSSGIALPKHVVEHLKSGKQHVDIMNQLENIHNISSKNTWGIYTHSTLNRTVSIKESFRNAIVSYITEKEDY